MSTDDATIQADSVIISPKVSGYLAEVRVQDNQPVRAGQVLARIDDRDYPTALAAARANAEAAQASIDDLQQEIAQQQLAVTEARAVVAADRRRWYSPNNKTPAMPIWRAQVPARWQ